MSNLSIFDDKVPYQIREKMWDFCINSLYKLGWEDTDEPEKYDLNIHSHWTSDELQSTDILPYVEKCINQTEWFENKNLSKVVCNLIRPDDVHYIHIHQKQQVCLYYVNLDWRDGWHGETLFYNTNNLKEIAYTSSYIPGRIILFDGSIPHAIRPQSVKAPKFRFTLSLFFE